MQSQQIEPPREVAPVRLFELLSDPAPRWPIAATLAALGDIRLSARPLTPLEWARARQEWPAGLLSAAVLADGEPLFPDAVSVGYLTAEEAHDLCRATMAALDVVAPTYGRIDVRKWQAVLADGAAHSGSLVRGMVACVEPVGLGGYVERPDRYWRIPMYEITDGQWLAFRAARRALELIS